MLLAQHHQIISGHSLAEHADEVIAIEVSTGPAQLADGIDGYRVGVGTARHVDGLGPGRDIGGRDERFRVRKVQLHCGSAADPRIAPELCSERLILSFSHDRLEGFAVDLPVDGRNHVANDAWSLAHCAALTCLLFGSYSDLSEAMS